jgi:hypothetical protein
VDYPPDLLDELARVFARVALDNLLKELAAEGSREEKMSGNPSSDSTSTTRDVVGGETPG